MTTGQELVKAYCLGILSLRTQREHDSPAPVRVKYDRIVSVQYESHALEANTAEGQYFRAQLHFEKLGQEIFHHLCLWESSWQPIKYTAHTCTGSGLCELWTLLNFKFIA